MSPFLLKQRGAVLAFALVMLVLLTLVATSMIQQNKLELQVSQNSREQTQTFANAEAILAQAKNDIDTFRNDVNVEIHRDVNGLALDDPNHQCTYVMDTTFNLPRQALILAGTTLANGQARIISTSCGLLNADGKSIQSGSLVMCSRYNGNTTSCYPSGGEVGCTSNGIQAVFDIFNTPNDASQACYQYYDPQFISGVSPPTGQPLCSVEVYEIEVTVNNGSKRSITAKHKVPCAHYTPF